jgi:hypothetical protein
MALAPSTVVWLGLLGPSEDGLDRTIVVQSWTFFNQAFKLEKVDSLALSILDRTPFSKDGETRAGRINDRYKVTELRRKVASIGFAAIGEDEIELDVLVERFERNVLHALGYDNIKSLTVTILKAQKPAVSNVADDMVMHGVLERADIEEAMKLRKLMISNGAGSKTGRS